MYLECSCCDINQSQWNRLMKGRRKMSYRWLVAHIKKYLPELYHSLGLQFYNPWEDQCYRTPSHYVLTHSAIEFFIHK
ncbi:MAG: hypothetical protein KBS70_08020 [Bacteroidales bacterium]|nr:hypothetical protein [Candidatus Colicola equi]